MLYPMHDTISQVERVTKDGLGVITRKFMASDVKCYFADLATTFSFAPYRYNETTQAIAIIALSDYAKIGVGDEITVDGNKYLVQKRIPMKDMFGIIHGYALACQDTP